VGRDEDHETSTPLHAWQLIGEDDKRIIRAAVADKGPCPQITVDGKRTTMSARLPQSPDQFSASVCEIEIKPTADVRFEAGWMFPPLPKRFERIVVLGDTGCRLTFYTSQACNNRDEWPFAWIAGLAASKKPDLVIHVGDYHYREKPCPRGKGCDGAAWGDRWEAWWEDFFAPAAPLLNQTPWVFVRGNHEDCERAGAGWFQFFGARILPVRGETCSDFIEPYVLRFEPALDLLVFDNSADDPRPYGVRKEGKMGIEAWLNNDKRWSKVRCAGNDRANYARIALMHKPLADYRQVSVNPPSSEAETCPAKADQVKKALPRPDEEFLSVTSAVLEHHWRPHTVLSGHLHSFQSVQHDNPFHQIVIGIGGTKPDTAEWPKELHDRMICHAGGKSGDCPAGTWRGDGADHIAVSHDFGFLVLDLVEGAGWFGRVYNIEDNVIAVCALPFEKETDGGSSDDMQPFANYAKELGLPNAAEAISAGGLTRRGCTTLPRATNAI
jgi:hypothetical protein